MKPTTLSSIREGAVGLEAPAGLRLADGTSVIDKISHLSSVSRGKPRHDLLRP